MAAFHIVSCAFTLFCCARAAILPLSCDFEQEQGLCHWTVTGDSKYVWTTGTGASSTSNGPDIDHTLGTADGTYIYTYATGSGVLITHYKSNLVQPSRIQCLTFWYNVFGDRNMQFNVYVEKYGGSGRVDLWSTSVGTDDVWYNQILRLHVNVTYKIVFEAVRKRWSKGRIALDDIVIGNMDCYVSEQDCDFEDNLCSWSTNQNKDYHWRMHSEETDTSYTGPDYDHTTGLQGTYIYLKASSIDMDEVADLTSSHIKPTNKACLTFWYHMHGYKMGTLKVFRDIGIAISQIWSQSGNQGDYWHQAFVNISSSQTFSLIFRGIRGKRPTSDIAIDDIYLIPQTCADFQVSLSHLTRETQDIRYVDGVKSAEGKDTAVTVGVIAVVIILACVVAVLIFVFRRSIHCKKEPKPQTKLQNNTVNLAAAGDYRSDYTGNQDIALPNASGHVIQLAIINDGDQQYDEIGNEEHTYTHIDRMTEEQTRPPYEYVDSETNDCIRRNKQDKFNVGCPPNSKDIQSTHKEGHYSFAKEDNLESNVTEDYAVLDPNETVFNRSNVITDVEVDAYNKPDRSTNMENDLTTEMEDQYDVSNDGTYDASNKKRHKETENVYSHTVDSVYDTSSPKRAEQENENAYDHFCEDRSADDKA